jgi:hypothetical protein
MKKAIQRLAGAMLLLAAFQAFAVSTASADTFIAATLHEVKASRADVLITIYRGRECPNYQCRDTTSDLVLYRQPSGAYFPHTLHPNNFLNGVVQVDDLDVSLNGTYTYKVCVSDQSCSASVSVTILPLIFNPLNVHAVTSVDKPTAANLTWTNKGDAVLPIRIDRHGPHDGRGGGWDQNVVPEKSWTLPAGTTQFADTGLGVGQWYSYEVCAITGPPAALGAALNELCTDSNRFETYPPPPQAPQSVTAKFGSFGHGAISMAGKQPAVPNVAVTWNNTDKFTEWFEVERLDTGWTLAGQRQNPGLTTFLDRMYSTRIHGWSWRVCAGNMTGRTCSAPVTLGNLEKQILPTTTVPHL